MKAQTLWMLAMIGHFVWADWCAKDAILAEKSRHKLFRPIKMHLDFKEVVEDITKLEKEMDKLTKIDLTTNIASGKLDTPIMLQNKQQLEKPGKLADALKICTELKAHLPPVTLDSTVNEYYTKLMKDKNIPMIALDAQVDEDGLMTYTKGHRRPVMAYNTGDTPEDKYPTVMNRDLKVIKDWKTNDAVTTIICLKDRPAYLSTETEAKYVYNLLDKYKQDQFRFSQWTKKLTEFFNIKEKSTNDSTEVLKVKSPIELLRALDLIEELTVRENWNTLHDLTGQMTTFMQTMEELYDKVQIQGQYLPLELNQIPSSIQQATKIMNKILLKKRDKTIELLVMNQDTPDTVIHDIIPIPTGGRIYKDRYLTKTGSYGLATSEDNMNPTFCIRDEAIGLMCTPSINTGNVACGQYIGTSLGKDACARKPIENNRAWIYDGTCGEQSDKITLIVPYKSTFDIKCDGSNIKTQEIHEGRSEVPRECSVVQDGTLLYQGTSVDNIGSYSREEVDSQKEPSYDINYILIALTIMIAFIGMITGSLTCCWVTRKIKKTCQKDLIRNTGDILELRSRSPSIVNIGRRSSIYRPVQDERPIVFTDNISEVGTRNNIPESGTRNYTLRN